MKKTLRIIIGSLLILSFHILAKGQAGIYATSADYKNNKLTCEQAGTKNNLHNIHLHDFFGNTRYLTITCNGQKRRLKKSDVYGFKNNDKVYRFYKNIPYLIAEAGSLYIYLQTEHIAQSKGYKIINTYYFSISPGGDILPLTLDNLKSAYSNNNKFIDLLDQYIRRSDVSEYDPFRKTFKVNYVYNKALKQ
jgi:hypothetical protein